MTHNKDFTDATRSHSGLLESCARLVDTEPQTALDRCYLLQLALGADTRLRGHSEYVRAAMSQSEAIMDLAKQRIDYLISSEQDIKSRSSPIVA